MSACNSCEPSMINGIFCHETGCPNQGQRPRKEVSRAYVGIRRGTRDREFFRTKLEPTEHYYPEYAAVIGPFRTVRGAKWAAANPFGQWVHVRDAEIAAKGDL